MLAYEEGYRSRAYHCSEGYPTLGYGFRLGPKHSALRNYQAVNLPRRVGDLWLRILIEQYHLNLCGHPRLGPIMQRLNIAQQGVLISMSYQLGIDGLLAFHKTLSALEDQDLDRASAELLDSLWAKQTPDRAKRHSQQLANGRWAEVYRRG